MSTRVIVGFSGGVDSTAAAVILKNSGYEVAGLYFDVFGKAPSDSIINTAKALDIKLYFTDASDLFREKVIEPFKTEYALGRTPNPCILCNPSVKFKILSDFADTYGFDYIATGHYAGIEHTNVISYVKKSANISKDQSYMLYRLPQEILKRTIFPLCDMKDKNSVRQIAKESGLSNWEAHDSQDICFIPDGNYADFLLSENTPNKEGCFKDTVGNILAPHKGILYYTVGQRKGLGIALGKPAFVNSINAETGDVVLGDEKLLFHNNIIVNQLYFSGLSYEKATELYEGSVLKCKLRYSAKESECCIHFTDNNQCVLTFDIPQRAPTPGQSAVFYNSDLVIGGGFIVK